MRYSETTGQYVPSAAEQMDSDIAADGLDKIEDIKRAFADVMRCIERNAACLTLHVTRTQIRNTADIMEEALDDLLDADWGRLYDRECSAARSTAIPSFYRSGGIKGALTLLPSPNRAMSHVTNQSLLREATQETQCGICSDYHYEDAVPYVCQTGDGQ